MFNRKDLWALGLSRTEIDRRCEQGVRLRRGTYAPPGSDDDQIYRWSALAVLASSRTGAALAGPTAAFWWHLPLLTLPRVVTLRGVSHGSRRPGVQALYGGADYVEIDGALVTTPAWTVVDCARLLPLREGLIIADAALHEQLCTRGELAQACRASRNRTGVAKAKWVTDNADPAAESPGETWMRMVVRALGYDTVSQYEIRDGDFVAYIDLMLDDRTGLEFDGMIKYVGERPDRSVMKEKVRQAHIEELGLGVLRVVWQQLEEPRSLDRRIQARGVQRVRPAI